MADQALGPRRHNRIQVDRLRARREIGLCQEVGCDCPKGACPSMDRYQWLKTIHPYLLATIDIGPCLIAADRNETVRSSVGVRLFSESKRFVAPQALLRKSLSGIAATYNPHLGSIRPRMTHVGIKIKTNRDEKETRLVRTSITHPLRIDDLPLGNGRLGITFCPGKKGDTVFCAVWDRALISTWTRSRDGVPTPSSAGSKNTNSRGGACLSSKKR